MSRRLIGLLSAALFVFTVYAANWLVTRYGPVAIGFGLVAPAGVYVVGLAFTLRDIVHRTLGRWFVIGAILVGAVLSYFVSANAHIPGGKMGLAVASAIAFLFSELADLSVYEPLRERGWVPAVVVSNIVGLVVDSALFLWLAFGSLAFFWGQVVGKAYMTAIAVTLLALWQSLRRREVAIV